MNHYTVPSFWEKYENLPKGIKEIADKNFNLLKMNPNHPSLHFKKVNNYWSVRVGIRYRAIAIEMADGLLWFWIGNHSQYDNLIKS